STIRGSILTEAFIEVDGTYLERQARDAPVPNLDQDQIASLGAGNVGSEEWRSDAVRQAGEGGEVRCVASNAIVPRGADQPPSDEVEPVLLEYAAAEGTLLQ